MQSAGDADDHCFRLSRQLKYKKREELGFRGLILDSFKLYLSQRAESVLWYKVYSKDAALEKWSFSRFSLRIFLFLLNVKDLLDASRFFTRFLFADDICRTFPAPPLYEDSPYEDTGMTFIIGWLHANTALPINSLPLEKFSSKRL